MRRFAPGQTIRGALIAGFAVVFLLWLASAYELARNIRAAEMHMSEARQVAARGQQVLTTIATRVMLGSIYLRDALMDATPEARSFSQGELERLRAEVEAVLPHYQPQVDTPAKREQWAKLQAALGNYWKSREMALAVGEQGESPGGNAAMIRGNLTPARQSVLELISSLGTLEQASIEGQEEEIAQFHRSAERRVVTLASLSLVVGLVVAFIAARHVARLEGEIERRQSAELRNRLDLERLSAKLVTAQEEERRSLARELHDAVGQALTAIRMEVGVALRSGAQEPRARKALDQARTIAESTLQSVRDLSQFLHPSMLDDFGLPETIAEYLRSFSDRSGIRTQLIHERMDDRLPVEVEVCAYRIVQEALTNVARHSGASTCTVALVRREDALHLAVEDDGQGLAAQAAPGRGSEPRHRGLGLIGMRERAQALAGSFVVENRLEGGTRIAVRLPVPPSATPGAEAAHQLAG